MLQEFCTQTGVEKEVLNARWLSCQVRLLKYAPLEQRKAVKSIVRDMETTGFDDEGIYIYVYVEHKCCNYVCSALLVLLKTLLPRPYPLKVL